MDTALLTVVVVLLIVRLKEVAKGMVGLKKEKGFTLVEAMVSILLLTILLLGLLGGLLFSYEISIRNLARSEAVKIAEEFSNRYRDHEPHNIPASYSETVQRRIRNRLITYNVNISSEETVAGYMKRVTITVTWQYKGQTFSHSTVTLVGIE